MKKTIYVMLLLCACANVKAQNDEERIPIMFKAGYGFGDIVNSFLISTNDISSDHNYTIDSKGTACFKIENMLTSKFSVGINAALSNLSVTYTEDTYNNNGTTTTYHYTIKEQVFSIGTRLNFHFAHVKNFDPYWGFGVGYRKPTYKYEDDNPYANDEPHPGQFPLYTEITLGANYFFNKHIGMYMETGFSQAVIQFGLFAKF